MSPVVIGLIGLAGLFLMIFLRVPIGIALAIAGVAGYASLSGIDTTLNLLGSIPFEIAYNYDLSIIALFVLMGNLAMVSGMSRDLYDMARSLVGHWPGGLASATVVGCAGFAAVSGSSLASAVTMGRVALPEMKRYGCTLGILIPPSTGFIIYALLTEESIGQLFLAGVLPGLLLTVLFMITVLIVTAVRPGAGPRAERMPMIDRLKTVGRSSALIGIVFAVLGGIYFGVFTPVEAAAVGAFLTVVLTVARGKMTWQATKFCVLETIKTFSFVYLILIGAFLFNPFLAVTQIPLKLAAVVDGLEVAPLVILGIIVVAYIIMGTFLEGIAMLVLTIPIVFPVIKDLGYDPIWFGVLLVVVLEMSLISPPLGLNVFVVKGISDGVPMGDIFVGVLPFWAAMFVCAVLLIMFPEIALFLPETMIR